jgi:hypothetical protein
LAAVRAWRRLRAANPVAVDIPAVEVAIPAVAEDSPAEADHTRVEARRFLVPDRVSQVGAYNSRV